MKSRLFLAACALVGTSLCSAAAPPAAPGKKTPPPAAKAAAPGARPPAAPAVPAPPPVARSVQPRPSSPADLAWFRDAKLGLFIHWGPSSLSGKEISWSRQGHPHDHPGLESTPPAEYDALYKKFNPVKFDADAWMALAREAGCRYVVFITKHHDGFCLWPSKLTSYTIASTPFRRDICKEIAEAAHRHGLKLGWYYSTRDWTHPDYLVGDNRKYDEYYRGQVNELLTRYGKVDIMWFDHVAGNWRDWDFASLFRAMYSLHPHLLVNNRAAAFIRPTEDAPPAGWTEFVGGDFDTPEQRIGAFQYGRVWESCMTMTQCADGGGWSWRPDGRTRPLADCIRMFVSTVTGDGNLLLDIGPLPTGEIAPDQVENLKGIGKWLAKHGETIYGTRGGPWVNGTWGGSTYRGKEVFVHVFEWKGDGVSLPPIPQKIVASRALTGGGVEMVQSERGVDLKLSLADRDPIDTIISLTLDRPVTGPVPSQ